MSCVCIVNVFFSLFENRKGKKKKGRLLVFLRIFLVTHLRNFEREMSHEMVGGQSEPVHRHA